MHLGPALPRPGGTLIRYPLISVLALFFTACRPGTEEKPPSLPHGLTWSGRAPASIRDSVPADTAGPYACIRVHQLEFAGAEGPLRLELRRFRSAHRAFLALQKRGDGRPIESGCLKLDSGWGFVHGEFLGLADTSTLTLTREEFRQNLAFARQPAFALPGEFEAFPLLGRIPGSERVVEADFLGAHWNGPIFSIGYLCHGDTGLAFRGYPPNEDSLLAFMAPWKGRREILSQGLGWRFSGTDEFGRPMILGFFPEGILGFSGCYDSRFKQEFVEKMQKMRIFWPTL